MWLGDSRLYKAYNINHYKCQKFGAHCTEAVFNGHTIMHGPIQEATETWKYQHLTENF